jgi:hypothetical protein
VAWGVLVALTLVLLTPGVALADQENYYLGPEGVPQAQMMMNPLGGEMPNYDRGRDVEPGLLLERTTLGLAEEDAARHQQWLIDLSGQRVAGFPSMVVWSAAAGFEAGKHGVFTLYVLDCDRSGASCERLGSRSVAVDTGAGGEWVESVVDLSEIDHTFGDGRNLAVRLVVPSASDTDMMFAYGYAANRSRLTIHSERPAASVTATAQLSAPAPVDFAAETPDTGAAVAPVVATAAPSEDVPEETGSIWPWLITLALSTAGLVAVGALLMATLTKPGRHQQSNEQVRVKSDGLSRVGSSEL